MLAGDLPDSFRRFAATTAQRAPLYARLSPGIADRPDLLAILEQAPEAHRVPVNLFAAVHDLLLADPGQPLAAWYPNLTAEPRTDDPLEAFVEFCAGHHDALVERVSTRFPQTNEIGRGALLLVGLAAVEAGGRPLAQLDVGASAGLNLLLEHYGYDYSGHRLGPDRLVLPCEVSGTGQLPAAVPSFSRHLGLDRDPVDLEDPDQARWLEACVWPDQTDRFHRLQAAIGIAREQRVEVRRGDAVKDLAAALDALGETGHPVVTTSWVLSYLTDEQRAGFVDELTRWAGRDRDLSWVYAEAPAYAGGLPGFEDGPGPELTVLGVVQWRGGVRTVRHLATCHPHGYTMRWLPAGAAAGSAGPAD